jgi:acetate kinase
MAAHPHCLLTINGGSSSIRFALFSAGVELRRLMSGRIERIGLSGSTLRSVGADPAQQETQPMPTGDHQSAATALLDWLGARVERGTLVAIGHRIVHGGPDGNEPQRLTPELLARLKALKALDPEHLPLELGIVEAMQARYPGVAQLACFDTAFHRDLPRVARLLPIPRRYEAAGVRRYGFHGLSYEYLLGELARLNQEEVASGRLILAHLGNGSSMTAVHRGRSIDTTMAFTPAAGLPMSTRSGDLDPGLGSYLARTEAMSAAQFARMTTRESGLLGLSETSADMRDLLGHEASDVRAREAVELYCYQVRKQIGAYAAALGGMDALVFTGGVGENAPSIRARICEGLSFLGILVDPRRNAVNAALISSDSARVKLRVIATDEELVIARAVQRALPAIRGPDP